jgi:type II secretory ATPase GspE/PulE/Tfp pilus assembly ATPase PilB-like protein
MPDEPVQQKSAYLVPRGFDAADHPSSVAGSQGPVGKLCDLILTEALLNRAGQVRLVDADPGTVEYRIGENWRSVMRIPAPAQRVLLERLRQMAGLQGDARPQSGTLHILYDAIVRSYPLTVEAAPPGGDIAIIDLRAT